MFVNLKQILHDQVNVYVETGARSAYLFSVEWYNNNIILTPLNPCIGVNSDTVEDNGNQILLKQSIYHDTVKVWTSVFSYFFWPILTTFEARNFMQWDFIQMWLVPKMNKTCPTKSITICENNIIIKLIIYWKLSLTYSPAAVLRETFLLHTCSIFVNFLLLSLLLRHFLALLKFCWWYL